MTALLYIAGGLFAAWLALRVVAFVIQARADVAQAKAMVESRDPDAIRAVVRNRDHFGINDDIADKLLDLADALELDEQDQDPSFFDRLVAGNGRRY